MSFEINRRKCAEGVIRLVGAILEGQQIQAYGNKWIDKWRPNFDKVGLYMCPELTKNVPIFYFYFYRLVRF